MLGAFSTRSFGESPKDERGSHLSQILEDSPHPKYYLSAKACAGILNRADRRGKILPPKLREALERQSGLFAFRVTGSTEPKPQDATEKDGRRASATPSTPLTDLPSPLSPSTCETPPETQQAAISAGGGIGEIGDPAFTVTADYSHAVALEHHPQDSRIKISENGTVQTLASNMGMGGNNVPLVMETQNSRPVNLTDPPPVITATCGSFIQTADGVSSTLLARDYKDPQIVCYQHKEARYDL